MKYYLGTKRDKKNLVQKKTNEDRELARKFEKGFFEEVEIRWFLSIINKISQIGSYA